MTVVCPEQMCLMIPGCGTGCSSAAAGGLISTMQLVARPTRLSAHLLLPGLQVRVESVSLGQGQGPVAQRWIDQVSERCRETGGCAPYRSTLPTCGWWAQCTSTSSIIMEKTIPDIRQVLLPCFMAGPDVIVHTGVPCLPHSLTLCLTPAPAGRL
jgi:hypothetical protein